MSTAPRKARSRSSSRCSNLTTKISKLQGYAEGEAKGRAEERLEMVRKMKANGLSPESITLYTGLTTEQVAEL